MMQSLHTGRWEGRDVQRRKKKQCALPPCWRIGTGRCCRRRAHEMACLQFRVRALFLFPLVQLNCAECMTERKLSPISFVQMGASAPASCQFKNFFLSFIFFSPPMTVLHVRFVKLQTRPNRRKAFAFDTTALSQKHFTWYSHYFPEQRLSLRGIVEAGINCHCRNNNGWT